MSLIIVITREEEIGLFGSKNLDGSLLDAKMGFILDSDVLDTVIIGDPTHISLDIEIIGKSPLTREWNLRREYQRSVWQ